MSLTVKVAFGEENRRITVNKTITYADLTTLLTKLFNGTNIQKNLNIKMMKKNGFVYQLI